MKLIIGLGNPGKQYETTRHNAGFIVLDEIKQRLSFGDFNLNAKFEAEITEGQYKGEKIILAKPQTFMNLSGRATQKILSFYKMSINDLIVLHDDLDIDLGSLKTSTDSSAAGHNGVASIINSLGTQKFKRLRIGIEGTERKKERIVPGDVFVLQNFSDSELEKIKAIVSNILEQL